VTPCISAAVVADPSRPEAATVLAARLRELGPVVAVHPEHGAPMRGPAATVRAWRAAAGTGSSHHLVVLAGAEPVPSFVEEVLRAVARRPDAALALSVDCGSWTGAVVRLAALRECAWAVAVPRARVPTLAVVLPSAQALAFADFAEAAPASGDDGDLVARFSWERRIDLLIRVHSLVTGPDARAAAEHPADHGRPRDEVSPLPTVLPRLHDGRAQVALWDAGSAGWRRASWPEHMARIGRCWPGAAPAAAFVAMADGAPPRERERLLPLAEVVRYGIALGATLNRAPPETSAGAVRPCLCTAVRCAVRPQPQWGWPTAWTDELTDVLWRAVGFGARLRSNHGVAHWAAEELRRLPEEPLPHGSDTASLAPGQ